MRPLDRFDYKILALLQESGRKPLRTISQQIGLSQTPCHERIKRLEKRGYLQKYYAEIDLSPCVDFDVYCMKLVLARHRAEDSDTFEKRIQKYAEVIECHALGGSIDYLLKLVVAEEETIDSSVAMLLEAPLGIGEYSVHTIRKTIRPYVGMSIEGLQNTANPLPFQIVLKPAD